MYIPPGRFVYLASAIKEMVDLPVFCIGRINDPIMAEDILAKNQADIVGMTRANICDPELPNKAREGRLDEIRRCIACNEGCWGRITVGQPITCAINPSVGREKETEIIPASVKKKVMVIGGGIAGMEAARVAALRGHSVSLYEKDEELGGQLQIAAKSPSRHDMAEPVRFYEIQFKKLGVDVHLNTTVDEETVRRENPDAVIMATGGVPGVPPVAGVGAPNVVQARDVLTGKAETGDNVVIYATEQGMEGLTTADFLAERGKKVELCIPYPTIASKVEMITGMMLLPRLYGKGVTISILSVVRSFENNTVVTFNPFSMQERRIEGVDTLVLATGSKANDGLWKALQGQVKEIYGAGQCVAPRKMLESTLDGLRVGLQV
jgi:2,4-dienoyl-CoA reductase (NADPH2)